MLRFFLADLLHLRLDLVGLQTLLGLARVRDPFLARRELRQQLWELVYFVPDLLQRPDDLDRHLRLLLLWKLLRQRLELRDLLFDRVELKAAYKRPLILSRLTMEL